MSRITVLGGCGGIGSVAVRTLAGGEYFSEVVIAENRYDAACKFADEFAGGGVSAIQVDVEDPAGLRSAIEGSSVVLNCVGPFYRFGPTILAAVIEAGIDYVDVCDDLDATEKMLAMDGVAREAGVSALLGMGNSPGMANILARFCADELLSETESVDIYHVHGGEPEEGAAVVKHRIHAMTNDIPVFIDGEFITVRMLEESGQALVEETEFKDIGTFPTYPYPHPETITMPKHFDGIKRVANLGFVIPADYFQLTMDAVRLGVCSKEPIVVGSLEVVPLEFAVAFILSERPRLLAGAGLSGPMGCLKVVVKGKKDGGEHTYVFSMFSREAGAGEGTGIPAALGAILMLQGKISGKGVLPPEACVKPGDMIQLAGEVIKGTGMGDEVPIHIEHIDGDGNSESIALEL